ncbi:MAG: AraC family transcriptional regulator [Devosia sp.]|uniref:helix-turn-helix domain-containing protein n=1 Tax=Devosia sp. TaxID=1871048 RepID=UPI0024CBEC09|nr:helix-turn-helix domain-containing protein [Devosia sp.]UYO01036.1 MAG: AraC family transcriptional regulator [Devosia sp.]
MIIDEGTPYQPRQRLLTGHFHEISGYRAVRRGGVADWLLVLTTGGRGRFGHAGGDLVVEDGDWVLVRPGTPHDYGVEAGLERWDLLWAHFQPRADWMDWLAWPAVADGLMHLRPDGALGAQLRQQFLAVHALSSSAERRREALAFNALEALLLGCDAGLEKRQPLLDHRIRRALHHIEDKLTQKLLIEDIASVVGMSASRLAHLFRAETGTTLQRHIELRRMQMAADLLRRTSFPVKQVAASTGFESQFYFSQRFRKIMGLSPQQFRAREDRG